jgi:hypothetical protein
MATVVGQHIILDCREDPQLYNFFVEQFPNYKIIPVMIGGHNDAVFCLLKPGLLVSTYHHSNYTHTLPNWTVKFIENQSWNAIPTWRQLKHSNTQKWWVPDDINNPEFDHFVNTWLNDWVGFVGETVFDVNMLQIDDRTVLVNNFNKDMFDFFKQWISKDHIQSAGDSQDIPPAKPKPEQPQDWDYYRVGVANDGRTILTVRLPASASISLTMTQTACEKLVRMLEATYEQTPDSRQDDDIIS